MKTIYFQSTIVESEEFNKLFTRVKIHVAYEGLNRNNSYISRETFEKAANSAKFCPIVGEFSETLDDFMGHGGKIEITDSSIKYVQTTMPYGCIGVEEPTWELVEEDDGIKREYFTLTGYLWNSRYPELNTLIDEGKKSHSMEVQIESGDYKTINGNKVFAIDDMIFSGFCILGNTVEPCFQGSDVSTYSLDKPKFKNEFSQMMAELKYALQTEITHSTKEGGNKMSEENKTAEFVLTSEQLKNELRRELAKSVTEDDWGYKCQDYYFVDYLPDQNLVIARDWDDMSFVGFNYSLTGDAVVVDFETEKRFKIEYVPMEVPEEGMEFNLFTKEQMDYKLQVKEKEIESKVTAEFEVKVTEKETALTELQSQFEVVKTEKEELETFKLDKLKAEKEEKINAVFESVSDDLTEDELAPFKEKAFEMEVEDLKKELFALIGQKEIEAKSKFNLNNKKPMGIALDTVPEETVIANSYDSIIKKYNNK